MMPLPLLLAAFGQKMPLPCTRLQGSFCWSIDPDRYRYSPRACQNTGASSTPSKLFIVEFARANLSNSVDMARCQLSPHQPFDRQGCTACHVP